MKDRKFKWKSSDRRHETPTSGPLAGSLDLRALADSPTLKILVIADTHGSLRLLFMVLQKIASIDLILHLGDHAAPLSELTAMTGIPILGVAGNCDGHSAKDLPDSLRLQLSGYRIFLTHGHRFRVKHDLHDLITMTMTPPVEADLVLYGHTHHYQETRQDREGGRACVFLNPGSACLSPFNPHPSCALVNLSGRGIEITKWTPPESE